MPFASFSDDFAMYDVTPVENLFLLEFMPTAPGDFVRVYLYGLMLCHHPVQGDGLTDIAGSLNLPEETVLAAFHYWEQKGLLVGLSDNPPAFRFLNVRNAVMNAESDHNPAYAYADFNDQLQSLFDALLHPQQYRQAMEWVEDLNLPSEIILYMAKNTVDLLTLKNGGKPRSVAYVFKVLNSIAMDWAVRDIRTMDGARHEIERQLPPYRMAQMVLASFNLRRNPTDAELKLSQKWVDEWHFTEADVQRALTETAKSAAPSFAYLDGILARHASAAQQLQETLSREEETREAVKRLLLELGAGRATPTPQLLSDYNGMLAQGFAPETLLRAAAMLNKKNKHAFRDLQEVLPKWLSLGLTTPEAADAYVKARRELRTLTLQIYEQAGIDRSPTDADLDQTQALRKTCSDELILYAASLANGLKLPMKSVAKRVQEWADAGVVTLDAAQSFKRPAYDKRSPDRTDAKPDGDKRPDAAHNYAQRQHEAGYFDDLFEPLGGKEPS